MSEVNNDNLAASQGYYHIANNPHLYEPLRTNNFELYVEGLEEIVRAGMDSSDENKIVDAGDSIRFSVVSCDIPTFSQSVIDVQYGNNTLKYAGKPTFKDASVVINDYIGADGKSAIMAWQNLSFNIKNWTVGLAGEYKKIAYLIEYDPSWKRVRSWKLFGVWVNSVDNANYSNEDDTKKTVTAALSYDYAIMELD